ncbi:MAG TPA: glycosyltransferase family 2 protein [Candidatus Paceibacterota bacterium]|nr:glycosyltransferase family 2 protein [Candidatus Paceibacterota bacterium]
MRRAAAIYQWRMQSRLPLSVALITLNEEANLPRCLESIRPLAAEIVVVDSGSTDRTEEIARHADAVFVSQTWQGFTRQKNSVLERCTQPWVLCLDADEAVSPELATAIRQVLAGKTAANGFRLNRRTSYLGDWIWHAWYPEWCLRLVRRETARWTGADPHPHLLVTGDTEKLEGDLLHYSYANLQSHFERNIRYARTSADSLAQAGQRCRWYHLAISPWLALGKRLVLKQGFRDGWRGWVIAYSAFLGVLAKYAFLFEKQVQARHDRQVTRTPPANKSPGPKSSEPA